MTDTSPEAEAVRLEVLQAMSPGQRLLLATGWSDSLRDLMRANLRLEHPEASEARIFRLFVDRWLGPELAAEVYGPLPESLSSAPAQSQFPISSSVPGVRSGPEEKRS